MAFCISFCMNFRRSEEDLLDLVEMTKHLQATRDDVKESLVVARRLGRQDKLDEVSIWLSSVERLEIEIKELEEEYRYGQSLKKVRNKIIQCKKESSLLIQQFESLKDLAPSLEGLMIPSETVVGMESAFQGVCKWLEDEEVGTIGICGMAGMGKTTLLKLIHNNLLIKVRGFELVIWVVVSRDASEKKVQGAILESLGLFQHEDKARNASAIDSVLRGKRFALLLDDIWENINLADMGVPLERYDHQRKSKVIFTSRFYNLCHQMGDKTVKLDLLKPDEAWILFQKAVSEDTINSDPRIYQLARDLVNQCQGLPLAIVVAGRLLKDKHTLQDWEHALSALKEREFDQPMAGHLFPVLRITYDNLSSGAMKEGFLYCTLFPQEYRINKNQLVDYWICDGILDEYEISQRRIEGHNIIKKLIEVCLLRNEENCVTMHPLLHEMALRISSENGTNGKYFAKAGLGLDKLQSDTNWSETKRISLMDNKIAELPAVSPTWNKVSTLLLCRNGFNEIPKDLFEIMTELQVLDLSSCPIGELPDTIWKLAKLQYLNLSRTKLRGLPAEIGKLGKLEILDLSYIIGLNAIPKNLLTKFQNLQALNMYHCGYQVGKHVDDFQQDSSCLLVGGEVLLAELESLTSLKNLEIGINNDFALKKLQSSSKLQGSIYSLSIEWCESLTSFLPSSIQSMKNLRTFEVHNCSNLLEFKIDQSVILNSVRSTLDSYFNNLQHVKIENCWSLKEISILSFAANLLSVHIEGCMKLEVLIKSQIEDHNEIGAVPMAFLKLKSLKLHNLPELKSISDVALPFPSLEEIIVSDCPKLNKLPFDSYSASNTLRLIKGETEWFKDIEWEQDNIRDIYLPYFISKEF